MSSRQEVAQFWDEELRQWAAGSYEMSDDLQRWRASYAGQGEGTVDLSVFPEPYIGSLVGRPALVMLGLNPGEPAHEFQGADGTFTHEIRHGSFSQWASSAPYTSPAWESVKGRNKYHRDRLAFARRFNRDESVSPEDLLLIELYPFHSKRVTASMRPPEDIVSRFIFSPLAEMDVEFIFAFGKPWHAAAESLGLGRGSTVDAEWSTPSRGATTYQLPTGQRLVVLAQAGYAGPPGIPDTSALRHALLG